MGVIEEIAEPKNSYILKPKFDKVNLFIDNKPSTFNTVTEQCTSEHPVDIGNKIEAHLGSNTKSPLKEICKSINDNFDQSTKTIKSKYLCPPFEYRPRPTAGESPLIEPAQIVDAEEKFKALLAKEPDSNMYIEKNYIPPDSTKVCDSSVSKIISPESIVKSVDECKMKNINEEFKNKVFEIIQ